MFAPSAKKNKLGRKSELNTSLGNDILNVRLSYNAFKV